MLRVFMVLMANKNISGSIEVGEIVKTVWLKSSFGVVLGLLFWFSLITVNMFHLVFIVILLLFITKDSGRQNTESYRHRHWGYLLALFNFFLVLRVVYALMVYYSITLPLNSELMKSMVALTGIPYRYS